MHQSAIYSRKKLPENGFGIQIMFQDKAWSGFEAQRTACT
jgi:hypothetical protein